MSDGTDERADYEPEEEEQSIETKMEQAQREAVEQEEAERQVNEELYREQMEEGKHPWGCFCTRCDG